MKQLLFLFVFLGITQYSCIRTNTVVPETLAGNWRMILVKDNATGSTITKPSTITGEVEISFTPISSTKGTFIGKTPTNDIMQNDYTIGDYQSILIPVLSMTKVAETSWGNEFVANIHSSQEFSFDDCCTLNIRTSNKKLTFKKR